MTQTEEVFISYSHDSVEHVTQVLNLSNKLRAEGVDCVIDQYESAPAEGWPRWMDKKIAAAKYVLLVCTETYFKRLMGEETKGAGLGVKWESNLIYQHFYNSDTLNTRFIPIIFKSSDKAFIPTPLQATTHYCLAENFEPDYLNLYLRLTDQDRVKKPELGKVRPLPELEVKTNPAMFLSMPIDVDLWNKAKWSATYFAFSPNRPPVLGLAFRDKEAAVKIFKGWHERYGDNDEYEELRISIIEGVVDGEQDGYTVHVGPDPEAAVKRYKDAGYLPDRDLLMCVSRINRMNPPSTSTNLEQFKEAYRKYKTYFLAPGVVSEDGQRLEALTELGIYKGKVIFRKVTDIMDNDIDSVAIKTGTVTRKKNSFHP